MPTSALQRSGLQLAFRWMLLLFTVFFLLDLCGCRGIQQLRNGCTNPSVKCPACRTDDDCYVLSNPCLSSAHCVSKGSNMGMIAIGCAKHAKYIVPPKTQCRCINSACRIPSI